MASKTHTIEVDAVTAAALQGKAAAQGMTVSQLVADITALVASPVAVSSPDLAELDLQWASINAGEATVAHEDVVRWLQSWGTPAYKAWRDR